MSDLKPGIGDNEDLFPIKDYGKEDIDFDISINLVGNEKEHIYGFPPIKAFYNLFAMCEVVEEIHPEVNYNVTINSYPNLLVDYYVASYDEEDNLMDVFPKGAPETTAKDSIYRLEGDKLLLDLKETDLKINNFIEFSYTPSLLVEKNESFTMGEVYNNWTQFDKTDPNATILASWQYDSVNDYIYNSNNQAEISGYYNPSDVNMKNYTIEVEMFTDSSDDDMMGFCFRFKDENNYYSIEWVDGGIFDVPGMYLLKTIDGTRTELARWETPWRRNVWEKVKIALKDESIKIYHENSLVIEVEDKEISLGAYGPISKSQPSTYFRNLNVYDSEFVLQSNTRPADFTKIEMEKELTENTYAEILDPIFDEYEANNPGITLNKIEYITISNMPEYISFNKSTTGDVPVIAYQDHNVDFNYDVDIMAHPRFKTDWEIEVSDKTTGQFIETVPGSEGSISSLDGRVEVIDLSKYDFAFLDNADYDFNLKEFPRLEAKYEVNSYHPITNEFIDTASGVSSISKLDGKRDLLFPADFTRHADFLEYDYDFDLIAHPRFNVKYKIEARDAGDNLIDTYNAPQTTISDLDGTIELEKLSDLPISNVEGNFNYDTSIYEFPRLKATYSLYSKDVGGGYIDSYDGETSISALDGKEKIDVRSLPIEQSYSSYNFNFIPNCTLTFGSSQNFNLGMFADSSYFYNDTVDGFWDDGHVYDDYTYSGGILTYNSSGYWSAPYIQEWVYGDNPPSNYSIECDIMQPNETFKAGLNFRHTGTSYLQASITSGGVTLERYSKFKDPSFKAIASNSSFGLQLGQWYRLKVVATKLDDDRYQRDNIKVYVDGELKIDYTTPERESSDFASYGSFGPMVMNSGGTKFKNFTYKLNTQYIEGSKETASIIEGSGYMVPVTNKTYNEYLGDAINSFLSGSGNPNVEEYLFSATTENPYMKFIEGESIYSIPTAYQETTIPESSYSENRYDFEVVNTSPDLGKVSVTLSGDYIEVITTEYKEHNRNGFSQSGGTALIDLPASSYTSNTLVNDSNKSFSEKTTFIAVNNINTDVDDFSWVQSAKNYNAAISTAAVNKNHILTTHHKINGFSDNDQLTITGEGIVKFHIVDESPFTLRGGTGIDFEWINEKGKVTEDKSDIINLKCDFVYNKNYTGTTNLNSLEIKLPLENPGGNGDTSQNDYFNFGFTEDELVSDNSKEHAEKVFIQLYNNGVSITEWSSGDNSVSPKETINHTLNGLSNDKILISPDPNINNIRTGDCILEVVNKSDDADLINMNVNNKNDGVTIESEAVNSISYKKIEEGPVEIELPASNFSSRTVVKDEEVDYPEKTTFAVFDHKEEDIMDVFDFKHSTDYETNPLYQNLAYTDFLNIIVSDHHTLNGKQENDVIIVATKEFNNAKFKLIDKSPRTTVSGKNDINFYFATSSNHYSENPNDTLYVETDFYKTNNYTGTSNNSPYEISIADYEFSDVDITRDDEKSTPEAVTFTAINNNLNNGTYIEWLHGNNTPHPIITDYHKLNGDTENDVLLIHLPKQPIPESEFPTPKIKYFNYSPSLDVQIGWESLGYEASDTTEKYDDKLVVKTDYYFNNNYNGEIQNPIEVKIPFPDIEADHPDLSDILVSDQNPETEPYRIYFDVVNHIPEDTEIFLQNPTEENETSSVFHAYNGFVDEEGYPTSDAVYITSIAEPSLEVFEWKSLAHEKIEAYINGKGDFPNYKTDDYNADFFVNSLGIRKEKYNIVTEDGPDEEGIVLYPKECSCGDEEEGVAGSYNVEINEYPRFQVDYKIEAIDANGNVLDSTGKLSSSISALDGLKTLKNISDLTLNTSQENKDERIEETFYVQVHEIPRFKVKFRVSSYPLADYKMEGKPLDSKIGITTISAVDNKTLERLNFNGVHDGRWFDVKDMGLRTHDDSGNLCRFKVEDLSHEYNNWNTRSDLRSVLSIADYRVVWQDTCFIQVMSNHWATYWTTWQSGEHIGKVSVAPAYDLRGDSENNYEVILPDSNYAEASKKRHKNISNMFFEDCTLLDDRDLNNYGDIDPDVYDVVKFPQKCIFVAEPQMMGSTALERTSWGPNYYQEIGMAMSWKYEDNVALKPLGQHKITKLFEEPYIATEYHPINGYDKKNKIILTEKPEGDSTGIRYRFVDLSPRTKNGFKDIEMFWAKAGPNDDNITTYENDSLMVNTKTFASFYYEGDHNDEESIEIVSEDPTELNIDPDTELVKDTSRSKPAKLTLEAVNKNKNYTNIEWLNGETGDSPIYSDYHTYNNDPENDTLKIVFDLPEETEVPEEPLCRLSNKYQIELVEAFDADNNVYIDNEELDIRFRDYTIDDKTIYNFETPNEIILESDYNRIVETKILTWISEKSLFSADIDKETIIAHGETWTYDISKSELKELFDVPDHIEGPYNLLVGTSEGLIETEVMDNGDHFTIICKIADEGKVGSITWIPGIHNGYFYLDYDDEEK